MALIEIKNLTITYDNLKAVDDISFEVLEKDYLCIVGDNGSGKSTLLKGILGLTPVDSGEINYGITKNEVGYLPQVNAIPLDFPATSEEIIILGRQFENGKLPFYTKKDKEIVNRVIDSLGIRNICKKRIGELSGGQRQRVLLARALCREPKLLILDEPCAGLDEKITESLFQTIGELNAEGMAVMMVSHSENRVNNNAKRVLVMDTKVEFYGKIEMWREYRERGDKA